MRLYPENRAKELIRKFKKQIKEIHYDKVTPESEVREVAIQCAIVAVEEILSNHIEHFDSAFPNVTDYWHQVLNNLKQG